MNFLLTIILCIFFYTFVVIAQPGDTSVTPGILCAACKATMKELEKKLNSPKLKKRTEGDIMTAMDDICVVDNFRTYDFIPPKMVAGCHAVMQWDEDIERLLLAKTPPDELEQLVCFGEISNEACVGQNTENPQKTKPSVYVDGEQIDTDNSNIEIGDDLGKGLDGDKDSGKKKTKKSKKSKKKKKKAKPSDEL